MKYSKKYLNEFKKLVCERYAGIFNNQSKRDKVFNKKLLALNSKYNLA